MLNTIESDIITHVDAELFIKNHIDKAGVMIDMDKGDVINRMIIKYMAECNYAVCYIDDIGQSMMTPTTIGDLVLMIMERRKYINVGRCYNVGNGRKVVKLLKPDLTTTSI